ncbi:MAG: hypothetical protein VX105_01870 [Cyanobacteriota bacterium]|nr:hypothetical protein [Cyanobacteriota bacterium]
MFNRLVDSIQLQEGAGDFRLLIAPVVEVVTQLREANCFSKGLMSWTGYRSEEIAHSRMARVGGSASKSPLKLWRYALEGIFSFTVKPLKVWGVIGVLISFLSFVYAALIVLSTRPKRRTRFSTGIMLTVVACPCSVAAGPQSAARPAVRSA